MPGLRTLIVGLTLFGAIAVAAAPPEEEELDPKVKAPAAPGKAPLPAEDESPFVEEAVPDRGPKASLRLVELAAEARRATDPALQAYLGRFVVPHDLITYGNRNDVRVLPLPVVFGKVKYPSEFGISVLSESDQPTPPISVPLKSVYDIKHYEQVVLDATEKLFALPPGAPNPPTGDRLRAAESVLSSATLSLASLRESGQRRGPAWDDFAKRLAAKLADVRARRVELAADARDFALVAELADRYGDLYQKDRAVTARLNASRVVEAAELADREDAGAAERARTLLAEYESREPEGAAPAALAARKKLADRARAMLRDAERLSGSNQAQARNLLATAERIDPDNQDLRTLRSELKLEQSALVVAVKRKPVLVSPARARFDSERQVAALLFEGLTEPVPDAAVGRRFVPQLAAAPPEVSAGAREFTLGTAAWSATALGPVTSEDVAGTIRLMRQSPARAGSRTARWLAEPALAADDPTRVRLRLDSGHPDPRELATFPVLPSRWFAERNARIDDEAFARSPVGSGPYRLTRVNDDAVLTADPRYGSRPGRLAQPLIREIRLTPEAGFRDLPAELRAGRVQLVPDVPTTDLAKFTADNNLGGTARVATAADPMRTWALSINHRRPGLQNPEVRRAISLAIDREAILRKVFRPASEPEKFHRPMTGPFPPDSWASPEPRPQPLFNRALALSKVRGYLKTPSAVPTLELAFAADDPQAALACQEIAGMIDGLTAADTLKLVIKLQPLPPEELLDRVQIQGRYDLAYWPRDAETVWYPLALADELDPALAGPGGVNATGYRTPQSGQTAQDVTLGQLLEETRGVRDWSGRLQPLAYRVHAAFVDAMPFVPLWELDRHLVLSRSLKIRLPGDSTDADPSRLPPTTLFTGVGGWRLE